MAGKLSPTAALKIHELEGYVPKVAQLHSQVEQYASARTNPENWLGNIRRNADQLKLKFMGAGLDSMSQLCGAISMAAARAGNPGTKGRTLRELVGNLKFQLDLAMRTIILEDQRERQKEKNEEATK